MGNRAVVTFANKGEVEKYVDPNGNGEALRGFVADNPNNVGVYLHWNGGRDSVAAFCKTCKDLKFRGPASDDYGVARFVQVVCNFFGTGDGLSVGVGTLEHLDTDNYDNGVYVVDDQWEIVGREFYKGGEQGKHGAYVLVAALKNMMQTVSETCSKLF